MMRVLRFIRSAMHYGKAYIDLDGCLLKRFRIPPGLNLQGDENLIYWGEHLPVLPIIYPRLLLCYLLRLLGVRLIVWTNRWDPDHMCVTMESLGMHLWLFDEIRLRTGNKFSDRLDGPVMEDQVKFAVCGKGNSLIVEQL